LKQKSNGRQESSAILKVSERGNENKKNKVPKGNKKGIKIHEMGGAASRENAQGFSHPERRPMALAGGYLSREARRKGGTVVRLRERLVGGGVFEIKFVEAVKEKTGHQNK